ncbi:hypothetical protein K2X89_06760 [Myxococcota bacterium]|nr:hypothetical protein [Myxococcota bacterium]
MHAHSLLTRVLGMLVLGALFGLAPSARAQTAPPYLEYDVVFDAIAIQGRDARLVWTLANGDGVSNAVVQVKSFTTNGTPGTTSTTRGYAMGDLAASGGVLLEDRPGTTTEFIQTGVVLGPRLSFRLKTTNVRAAGNALRDTVSFHVLTGQANTPLAVTADPTRANALFVVELGHDTAANALTVYGRDLFQSAFSWTLSVTPVPEPRGALPVALTVFAVLASFRRRVVR